MKSIVGLGRALVDACINDEDIIPILKLLIGPIEQGHNHFLLDDDQAKYILSRLKTENFIAGGSVANTLRYCSRNGKP
ncbi:MAG: hypothetical protein GW780_05090, partial [Candidatus Aenigmarchaeota archaeon]|nr:hypothetical protein [Candidatus Aenigmarchaeota archaeon]